MYNELSPEEEAIGKAVVDAAYHIHRTLGPGLLEKIYEVCLMHELIKRGLVVERQLKIPIQYDGVTFEEGLILDLLIGYRVITEVKAQEQINPVWTAQILSQLKLAELRLGYLINFNVPKIKDGIRRIVL